MVSVVSRFLLAVNASWDAGPDAGGWIANRLGPFGPSVGHAVPVDYPAYAVIAIPGDEDEPARRVLGALLDRLDPFTGDQPVHCGIWEGFGWLHDAGTDPGTAPGMSPGVAWPPDAPRPSQQEIDRALARAREAMANERVERPDAEPLEPPTAATTSGAGPCDRRSRSATRPTARRR